jgi:hypothetical protein
MNGQALGGWVAFMLFEAAARRDANQEQAQRLREEIVPLLERLKVKGLVRGEVAKLIRIVMSRTQTIMGLDWTPDKEYLMAIHAMLGKETEDGQDIGADVGLGTPTPGTMERRQVAKRARARHRRQPLPDHGRSAEQRDQEGQATEEEQGR